MQMNTVLNACKFWHWKANPLLAKTKAGSRQADCVAFFFYMNVNVAPSWVVNF